MRVEGKRASKEGEDENERNNWVVGSHLLSFVDNVDKVDHQDSKTDDDTLADLQTVNPCIDIDWIGAEYWQHAHVDVK